MYQEQGPDGLLKDLSADFQRFQHHHSPAKANAAIQLSRALAEWNGTYGNIDPRQSERSFYANSKEMLELVWDRQSGWLASLLAKDAGFYNTPKGKERYRASLPHFQIIDDDTADQFILPLLVETRVPLERLLEIAKLQRGWAPIDRSVRVSDLNLDNLADRKPYVTRVRDPRWHLGSYPGDAIRSFTPDEEGSDIVELVNFYLQYPNFFQEGDHEFIVAAPQTHMVFEGITYLAGISGPSLSPNSLVAISLDPSREDFKGPAFPFAGMLGIDLSGWENSLAKDALENSKLNIGTLSHSIKATI